jgi:hypothetical protein
MNMNRTVAALALIGFVGAVPAWAQAPAGSLTEGHARSAMMGYGCSNLSGLSVAPSGSWHGQCQKGGQTINVMVDRDGKVSTGTASHMTEAHARSALTAFGCSNLSVLGRGRDGNWHGTCTKGGQVTEVMVDQQGKAAAAPMSGHMTEAHARAALMGYGCTNLSTLSSGADGSWNGQCTKGGRTVNVTVDPEGKTASK